MSRIKILKTKSDIVNVIHNDPQMMEVIHAVNELQLPDWWVCAGFLRTKIWDVQHGFSENTVLADVDVIYYDETNIEESVEKEWELRLHLMLPHVPWSVKNQARMHKVNNIPPYRNSEDAISKFPETATALGIKTDTLGKLVLTAPRGVEDAVNMVVRPTPYFKQHKNLLPIYKERQRRKNWQARWHKLRVEV